MDLIFQDGNVLHHGQRLHSAVAASETMERANKEKKKGGGKDKNDDDEDAVSRYQVGFTCLAKEGHLEGHTV
jgi:hypothetical protein